MGLSFSIDCLLKEVIKIYKSLPITVAVDLRQCHLLAEKCHCAVFKSELCTMVRATLAFHVLAKCFGAVLTYPYH
jgi:hypothetical protein